MRIRIWGARGSIPAPGPATARYGGNTSCVQVTLSDGNVLVLDAGSGIRELGPACAEAEQINILLTHLHLDHIQGCSSSDPGGARQPSWPHARVSDQGGRHVALLPARPRARARGAAG